MLRQRMSDEIRIHAAGVAIHTPDGPLTYGELGRQASRVASAIQAGLAGVAPHQNVGLLFDHGAESIIAVTAAVLSGCTYVPLHAGAPPERIAAQLEHARIGVIVTPSRYAALVAGQRARRAVEVIHLDALVGPGPAAELEPAAGRDGCLYLQYTSGSTGKPKAIMQTGENVLYFADQLRARLQLTSADSILMFAHIAFDAAVVDVFSALLSGAALYPYALHQESNQSRLPDLLSSGRMTIWHSVPTLFRHFTGALSENRVFPAVRTLLLGGEPVRPGDVQACRRFFPNATFGNLYGQSESSINSLWLLPPQAEAQQVTTGEPLGDTRLLVAGDDGALVEPLGVGQIVVASRHVAPGYWDDPALTARVFSDDPSLGRLYWTGDLGRLLPDGRIAFAGRRDHQVKIRGLRVELGEIEAYLCGHPGIVDAVVTCTYEQDEVLYLSCYFRTRAGQRLEAAELRAYLARFLPEAMLPHRYLQLTEWPRNANGKLDRQRLPAIADAASAPSAQEATHLEQLVLALWKRVLQTETVGLQTNFFDAGGNSLKLFQLQSLYDERSGEVIPLARFFEYPTIREFAAFVGRAGGEAKEAPGAARAAAQNRLLTRKRRLGSE